MTDEKRYLITVAEITSADDDAELTTLPVLTREVTADDPFCAVTTWADEITDEENS